MDKKRRILVADDDAAIREVIHILLEGEGYEIIEAVNGQEAIERMAPNIDLVILDVMMPGCSGITACSEIRKRHLAPILFLTAKSTDTDKIMGFSAGGDDYLAKPFSYMEMLSRVKALIRRYHTYNPTQKEESTCIRIQDITIDTNTHQVYRNDKEEVLLTDIEYQILHLLASNRQKIFSVQNIYESVWNEPYFSTSNNTVTVHIRNIRRKLEPDVQNPRYLLNVWGRGYRIV